MTKASDEIGADVVRIVAARADATPEQIQPSARLWHDLRLAGDDFADMIEELHRAHGVTLRGKLGDDCPTEGGLSWTFLCWPFNRKKTYRELTISDLVTAARTGVQIG